MTTLMKQITLETKLFLRGKQALFFTLAFPAIMILIFGSVFSNQTWSGVPAVNYLLPGIIVMALMMACMSNNAVKITSERDKGVYRRLAVTPLKRQILLMGDVFVRYLVAVASSILLIAIGVIVFNANITGNYLLFWFVFTIGVLVFISLGFVISTLVKNTNSAQALSMGVLFPFMFLGACFWPLDEMPTFLRPICEALPTLHLNNALRLIAVQGLGFGAIWPDLLVLFGWLIVCSIVAVKFFKWE